MRRPRSTADVRKSGWKWRPTHALVAVAALYLLFLFFKVPRLLDVASMLSGDRAFFDFNTAGDALPVPQSKDIADSSGRGSRPAIRPLQYMYGRVRGNGTGDRDLSNLERTANEAWELGTKAWEEVERSNDDIAAAEGKHQNAASGIDPEVEKAKLCPSFLSMSREELVAAGAAYGEHLMFLPCGLAGGSAITVVGTPHEAHEEYVSEADRMRLRPGDRASTMVSHFVVELQGLKAVEGEDPPRIFHLNPRVRGDWSKRPVIEHNTCYRMQWGTAQRCDGLPSKDDDDTVDGFKKCERWMRDGIVDPKESRTNSWLRRFVGRAKKPAIVWPFPFVEGKLFVLTLRAGLEGYHINAGGRHITSFPYRTGFTLHDATGLLIKGNVDVHSVYATSLPLSHPAFSHQKALEMFPRWKSHPLPGKPIDLFIGILSASNHFDERMSIRKTWMQSNPIKASDVAARFFVALNTRKEINALLKKEADYFGDIVILPFMDHYDLVVLKTVAICEYGVNNLTAAYIMKCDDDTFIRVDTVLQEIHGVSRERSLYMGNLNLFHRPLRTGKWAVTYEEWPEEVYPTYANGPGYIISSDIAKFILSQHANQSLSLFKMEDVSMGMWVEQFNNSRAVQYSHNWKFCQHGCVENYFTAHYQSPLQMICLWDKLARGRAHCCNFK